MSSPQTHGDTEAPLSGFDARLHQLFAWIQDHARELAIAGGALLLAGVGVVGVVEYRRSSEDSAQTELRKIDLDFTRAMGAMPGTALIPEPANEELARRAREDGIAALDRLIADTSGTQAALVATIRAAGLEIELGRFEAADTRLTALLGEVGSNDARRAIAQRMRAFTLEARGKYLEAAELYLSATEVKSYPAEALLYLSAAQNFERAGAIERAITAYEQLMAASPMVSQRLNVPLQLHVLEAKRTPASSTPESVQAKPEAAASD